MHNFIYFASISVSLLPIPLNLRIPKYVGNGVRCAMVSSSHCCHVVQCVQIVVDIRRNIQHTKTREEKTGERERGERERKRKLNQFQLCVYFYFSLTIQCILMSMFGFSILWHDLHSKNTRRCVLMCICSHAILDQCIYVCMYVSNTIVAHNGCKQSLNRIENNYLFHQ